MDLVLDLGCLLIWETTSWLSDSAAPRTLSKETLYTEEMVETSTGRLMVAYSGKPR